MSNYRDTRVGDINDLHREIKDLNTQLRDRKHANGWYWVITIAKILAWACRTLSAH